MILVRSLWKLLGSFKAFQGIGSCKCVLVFNRPKNVQSCLTVSNNVNHSLIVSSVPIVCKNVVVVYNRGS